MKMRLNTTQQGTAIPCARGLRPVLPMRGRNPRLNICISFVLLHARGPFCLACVALVLRALHAPPVLIMKGIRFHLAFTAPVVAVACPTLAHLTRWLPSACDCWAVGLSVVHGANLRPEVNTCQVKMYIFSPRTFIKNDSK